MDSRRRFRPRPYPLKHRGTVERSASGLVDWPSNGVGVATRRDRNASAGLRARASRVESTRKKSSVGRIRDVRTANRHRWARRVASGERVNVVKELGIMIP